MSCRKHDESSRKIVAKIPKLTVDTEEILPFTTSDFLQNVVFNDKFVSIVGYVQTVNEIRKIRSKDDKDLLLLKFLLNKNEGSKISCIAWNETASKFADTVKVNQILLIQNSTAKEKSSLNDGNMPYEILIKQSSKISILGTHVLGQENLCEIGKFLEIAEKCGCWIKIKGYLRDEFIKKHNNANEYTGTITDGRFRVEVLLNMATHVPYKQGQKLEMIAQIQAYENEIIYLEVNDAEDIELADETEMPLRDLLLIREIITKKPV